MVFMFFEDVNMLLPVETKYDEATAFADAENEYLIQKALDVLLKGKTVLMIARRLQTVVHADQILVMQKGKIA